MGEVVDLERYRKQRKRQASGSAVAGGRRGRDRAGAKAERSHPAAESVETGGADSDRVAKTDRDDQKAD